ncbi:MAG: YggS family pyridoxal phosphate-dependent enzyme [Gemmataceae bacterium]|nr:YggS family pyridoxal phosphate-dependent enzyme [Gemmataceae bacterium]
MNADEVRETLRERLASIEQRIVAACQRSRRRREDMTLVAVTKTVSAAVAALLPSLGIRDLGENRPQELWSKSAELPKDVRWHLIGHFQRNKVDRTLPLTHLIHAVDSVRLAEAISKEAVKQQRIAEVLLECNVSGEESKQGLTPNAVAEVAHKIAGLPSLRVRGLMTMAPFHDDPEQCRPVFVALRQLRDRIAPQLDSSHRFAELSMGMTNDFEVAIEEGATFIRVGTALFEGLSS